MRSSIESVVAIKVDSEPCCVEILVAAAGRSLPTEQGLPGFGPMPSDHAVVTLDLRSAQDLIDRLNRAVGVLRGHDTPVRFGYAAHHVEFNAPN